MEVVEGLLLLFMLLFPLLVERSRLSSWVWSRTFCRINAVPVAVWGAGSSGGTHVFHIFLVLKSGGEAAHIVFHEFGFAVSSLSQSKFFGFSEL